MQRARTTAAHSMLLAAYSQVTSTEKSTGRHAGNEKTRHRIPQSRRKSAKQDEFGSQQKIHHQPDQDCSYSQQEQTSYMPDPLTKAPSWSCLTFKQDPSAYQSHPQMTSVVKLMGTHIQSHIRQTSIPCTLMRLTQVQTNASGNLKVI